MALVMTADTFAPDALRDLVAAMLARPGARALLIHATDAGASSTLRMLAVPGGIVDPAQWRVALPGGGEIRCARASTAPDEVRADAAVWTLASCHVPSREPPIARGGVSCVGALPAGWSPTLNPSATKCDGTTRDRATGESTWCVLNRAHVERGEPHDDGCITWRDLPPTPPHRALALAYADRIDAGESLTADELRAWATHVRATLGAT